MMGGKSKAESTVVDAGANGSAHALKVAGTIDPAASQRWAGVMFSPGARAMSPANLSGKSGLTFWAKGDGKPAYVMVFSQARGYVPATKTFVTPPDWKQFHYNWSEFDGLDGSGTMGIFLGGGVETGPFEFQLDDVRLETAKVK
jgi:hypothetical protein